MLLEKTAKARDELKPGVRTLGQRERALLLLIGSRKSLAELAALFQPDAQALVTQLLHAGYLQEVRTTPPAPGLVDTFNGKRSLATTRMFLFDICERMFVRRAPQRAEYFREALRQARDRESMLSVGQALIAEIETVAGQERARSVSQRVALLLPEDAAS